MNITPRIRAIRVPFNIPIAPGQSVPRFVYLYLILGDAVVAIDSGVLGAESAVWECLAAEGLTPAALKLLVLTHSHPDHIGAARRLQEASGCRIAAPAAERTWIEDVALQQRQRPVPGFDTFVAGSVRVDEELADGALVGTSGLRALATPGHSVGSTSLLLEGDGVLFSGDAIPQPGGMPVYEDVAATARSLQRLLVLPGLRVLLSSWDEPRFGDDVYGAIRRGLDSLRTTHAAVLACAGSAATMDMGLCRAIVARLGLPPFAANPLVARSLAAHLQAAESAAHGDLFA